MTISEDFSKWAKNLSIKDISDKSKTVSYTHLTLPTIRTV